MRLGVEDRHHVGRVFGRAVHRPVRIHSRIATVRGDQVVQVSLGLAPFPGRDHDVALEALRPRRLGMRQLALGDAVGPVGKILERRTAEPSGKRVHHVLGGLARLHATHPRFLRRLELAERDGKRARGQLPELMTADAVAVLHRGEPVDLRDLLRNLALAAELARLRDLHHRIPVDRRIVLRRRLHIRRLDRGQVERLARLAVDLRANPRGRSRAPTPCIWPSAGRGRGSGPDRR